MPSTARLTLPPCALAALDSGAVRACPGFQPVAMRREVVRWLRAEPLPTPQPDGITCGHLGHQLSRRGYRSACAHPGGLPPGAEQVADRIRRRRRAVRPASGRLPTTAF
jgi:hypothetical protein